MNLLIVESPLQLLCAFEAIKSHSQNNYQLLIRLTGRGLNDQHLLSCANSLDLQYRTFKLNAASPKLDFVKNLFLWLRLASNRYETVYLGSFYSSMLKLIKRFIKCKQFVYLDDGGATIRAQNDIIAHPEKAVNWFTFFHLSALTSQHIETHDFEHLKQTMIQNHTQKGTYFIGQPVTHMIDVDLNKYVYQLNLIANQHSAEHPLIYIPHRVEDSETLALISKNTGIKILQLDIPIEIFFLQKCDSPPEKIYSFYSTALITLKVLFSDTAMVAIHNNTTNHDLKTLYDYFKKHDIQVTTLNY